MCIAIGPNYQSKRGILGAAWWHVARSPLRLFSLGTMLQLLLLFTIQWHPGIIVPVPVTAAIVLAFVGLLLFGILMESFPKWANRSPILPPFYSGSFFLITAGLLFIEASLIFHSYWMVCGMTALIFGWLAGLKVLMAYRPWIPARLRQKATLGMMGILGSGLAVTVSLVSL